MVRGRRRQKDERNGAGVGGVICLRAGKWHVQRHPARRAMLLAEHAGGARQLRVQLLLAAVPEVRRDLLLQRPRSSDRQGPE